MVALIRELMRRGVARETADGVYFSVDEEDGTGQRVHAFVGELVQWTFGPTAITTSMEPLELGGRLAASQPTSDS